jgi:hypothetical protein
MVAFAALNKFTTKGSIGSAVVSTMIGTEIVWPPGPVA